RLEQANDRLLADHSGFLIDCACGAPTWAPNFLAGRERKCGHCGQAIRIPPAPVAEAASEAAAEPADAPGGAERIICSICQCPIGPTDERMQCPECGLEFHTECWEENLGCSAYGCSQVNVLDPEAKAAAQPAMPSPEAGPAGEDLAVATATQAQAVPWEYALLGGSVLAAALGVLAFGVLSLVMLMAGS